MRLEIRPALLLVVALLATLSVGCASSARISQFETFAVAGTRYASAMDELLTESTTVLIDTNSMKLLIGAEDARQTKLAISEVEDPDEQERQAREFEEGLAILDLKGGLRESDDAIRGHLEAIRYVRLQVNLLAVYFSQLAALATTDAPEQFGDQLTATAESLNELSVAVKGSPVVGPDLAEAARGVGTLIVRGVQLRQLNRELESRKETIAEILRIHSELLEAIAAQVEQDRQLGFQESYRRLVRDPLLDLSYEPEGWKETRRGMLTRVEIDDHVEATRSALGKLENAWRKLLVNELTLADVQAVVADLQPVLTALSE